MLFCYLKKSLKPLFYLYKTRKEKRRAFHRARLLLDRGLYYNPYGSNEFRKLDKCYFTIKNLFHFCMYVNLKRHGVNDNDEDYQEALFDSVCYGVGQGKVVLLKNDKAYGIYDTSEQYLRGKNNYLNNVETFIYPCVDVISFDDRRKTIIMKRVEGTIYRDYTHDEIIVRELLYLGTQTATKVGDNNKVLFLQHGDAKRENIIWDNYSFCFIDLDGLQYLPPLFDVFHYLNNCDYKLTEIVEFINQNKTSFERICDMANIKVDNNPLDILFCEYIYQFVEWGGYYHDFKFLNDVLPMEYPATYQLINQMV